MRGADAQPSVEQLWEADSSRYLFMLSTSVSCLYFGGIPSIPGRELTEQSQLGATPPVLS